MQTFQCLKADNASNASGIVNVKWAERHTSSGSTARLPAKEDEKSNIILRQYQLLT